MPLELVKMFYQKEERFIILNYNFTSSRGMSYFLQPVLGPVLGPVLTSCNILLMFPHVRVNLPKAEQEPHEACKPREHVTGDYSRVPSTPRKQGSPPPLPPMDRFPLARPPASTTPSKYTESKKIGSLICEIKCHENCFRCLRNKRPSHGTQHGTHGFPPSPPCPKLSP